jgi:hypothetical protein
MKKKLLALAIVLALVAALVVPTAVFAEGGSSNTSYPAATVTGTGTGGVNPTPTAPTIVYGTVTNITANSATLNATINPNGADTTYVFQNGTTASGAPGNLSGSPSIDIGNGYTPVAVTITETGLSGKTQYAWRVAATNGIGEPPPIVFGNYSSNTYTTLPIYDWSITNPVPFGSVTVLSDGAITMTGTATVTNNSDSTQNISSLSVSNVSFSAITSPAVTVAPNSAMALAPGASVTVTFTLTGTAPTVSTVSTINLSGLTFTVTPSN